jgi:hypothetical protein
MDTAVSQSQGEYAYSTTAEQGHVDFTLDLPCPSSFAIWGVAWEYNPGGASGDADSYWVSVDGGDDAKWHFGCINDTGQNWTYSRFSDMPANDCVIDDIVYQLDAGQHTIRVRNREMAYNPDLAAAVARILVTNDLGYVPDIDQE